MLPRVNLVRTDEADYLLLSTNDAITRIIYSQGSWVSYLTTISNQFLLNEDSPLVLDIGANLGAYTVPIAKKIADQGGVVFAYEPQRIIFLQLCGNCFLNRLDNVYTVNCALGDAPGVVDIPPLDYALTANIGAYSLNQGINREYLVTKVNSKPDRVQVQVIDQLEIPKAPSLIKIDVEGMELNVLRGGVNSLEHWSYPPLLLEVWQQDTFAQQRKELIDFLESIGYSLFFINDDCIAQHAKHKSKIDFNFDSSGTIHMVRSR